MQAGDHAGAATLVTEEMLRIGVVGTANELAAAAGAPGSVGRAPSELRPAARARSARGHRGVGQRRLAAIQIALRCAGLRAADRTRPRGDGAGRDRPAVPGARGERAVPQRLATQPAALRQRQLPGRVDPGPVPRPAQRTDPGRAAHGCRFRPRAGHAARRARAARPRRSAPVPARACWASSSRAWAPSRSRTAPGASRSLALRQVRPDLEVRLASEVVAPLRMVKEPDELGRWRRRPASSIRR